MDFISLELEDLEELKIETITKPINGCIYKIKETIRKSVHVLLAYCSKDIDSSARRWEYIDRNFTSINDVISFARKSEENLNFCPSTPPEFR